MVAPASGDQPHVQRRGPTCVPEPARPYDPRPCSPTPSGGGALPAPPWLLGYIGVALVLGTAAALRATWPRRPAARATWSPSRPTAIACGAGHVVGLVAARRRWSAWRSSARTRAPPTSPRGSCWSCGGWASRSCACCSATSCAGSTRSAAGRARSDRRPRPPTPTTAAPTWTPAAFLAAVLVVPARLPPARLAPRPGRVPRRLRRSPRSPAGFRWGRAWLATGEGFGALSAAVARIGSARPAVVAAAVGHRGADGRVARQHRVRRLHQHAVLGRRPRHQHRVDAHAAQHRRPGVDHRDRGRRVPRSSSASPSTASATTRPRPPARSSRWDRASCPSPPAGSSATTSRCCSPRARTSTPCSRTRSGRGWDLFGTFNHTIDYSIVTGRWVPWRAARRSSSSATSPPSCCSTTGALGGCARERPCARPGRWPWLRQPVHHRGVPAGADVTAPGTLAVIGTSHARRPPGRVGRAPLRAAPDRAVRAACSPSPTAGPPTPRPSTTPTPSDDEECPSSPGRSPARTQPSSPASPATTSWSRWPTVPTASRRRPGPFAALRAHAAHRRRRRRSPRRSTTSSPRWCGRGRSAGLYRMALLRRPRRGHRRGGRRPRRPTPRARTALGSLCTSASSSGSSARSSRQTITFAADEFDASKTDQGAVLALVRIGVLGALVVTTLADRAGAGASLLGCAVAGCVVAALSGAGARPRLRSASPRRSCAGWRPPAACWSAIVAAEEMPVGVARVRAHPARRPRARSGPGSASWRCRSPTSASGGWRLVMARRRCSCSRSCGSSPGTCPESRRYDAAHAEVGMAGPRVALLAARGLRAPARAVHGAGLAAAQRVPARRGGLLGAADHRVQHPHQHARRHRAGDRRPPGRHPGPPAASAPFGVVGGTLLTVAMVLLGGWPMWGLSVGGRHRRRDGRARPRRLRPRAVPHVAARPGQRDHRDPRGHRQRDRAARRRLAVGAVGRARSGAGAAVGRARCSWRVLVLVAYPETAHRELEDLNPEDRIDPPGAIPSGQRRTGRLTAVPAPAPPSPRACSPRGRRAVLPSEPLAACSGERPELADDASTTTTSTTEASTTTTTVPEPPGAEVAAGARRRASTCSPAEDADAPRSPDRVRASTRPSTRSRSCSS